MEIRISVRALVEFVLREGDIDNRRHAGQEGAMQEGGRIHRMIQRRMGSDYSAEVSLEFRTSGSRYDLVIDGRADGVIAGDVVTIDEIKGTYRNPEHMKAPVPVHLAQAKCYAFMYALDHGLDRMKVRMTYVNMETEELRYFFEDYAFADLRDWFLNVVEEYKKWADFVAEWKEIRTAGIRSMHFPFAYREGQKRLVAGVYHTILEGKKLFLEAPTGVGKTISTVYPAIQAVGADRADRIFYLTAKTITRTAADKTFELLRDGGLRFKTVVLTARDKICFLEEADCNPEHCPYAKGHFSRVNEAMYRMLINEDRFDRETIERYAEEYQVCPFEFSLDMSLFADAIICDYNYAFDPHVYLRRFFGDGTGGGMHLGGDRNLFLVDEAHNLVERGREMYSASLIKEDFLELKRKVKLYDTRMASALEKCSRELLAIKRMCDKVLVVHSLSSFAVALTNLSERMQSYLEDHDESPVRTDVLEFYFEVSHFLEMYDLSERGYVTYAEHLDDGRFMINLFCVDPSENLAACMERAVSTTLFSATFLPIQYYKSLLGGTAEDYEMYAGSSFDNAKRGLFVAGDVTSKYTRRSVEEFRKIAAYIKQAVQSRPGNYLVFFPSHQFLEQVCEIYEEEFLDDVSEELLLQEAYMDEAAREDFLQRFEGNGDADLSVINMEIETEEKSLLGFCVMGGIFSEGIDLKNDRLIGAIVVGTGLPQICTEREILKDYFNENGRDGFDYAYRFPGMNKVLQAAGRVIRTAEDVGVVLLLDDRFLSSTYRRLYPREWETYRIVRADTVGKELDDFWEPWLRVQED